jgi:DNA-binding SARP family transcriptional activator
MMFRSFGPLTVTIEHRSVVVSSGRQRAMLTALLLRDGHVVSADHLAECVWGRHVPASSRRLIHTLVWRVRQVLGREAERLATRPPGYLLTASAEEYDVADFLRRVRAGRAALAREDPETAASTLAGALALWRGEPFADVPPHDEFAQVALALAEARSTAREDWFEAQLRLGDGGALIAELAALVRENPLRERLVSQLMLALYRGGRQSEALAAFHRLRSSLAEEMGIDPGQEIRDRYEAVLRADPSLEEPRRRVTAVLRPRGGSAPAAGGPADGPHTRWCPAQLPADVPGFTGRGGTLEQLDGLITATSEPVTAVISGTAGVGKTAMAVHWARRISGLFPDGQLYIDLHGWSPVPPLRPVEALGQLLRGLGLPAPRVPDEPNEAAALYRSMISGKRILTLLDNARDADQVRLLLPGTHTCPVLITSRCRLTGLIATHGAHRVDLSALDAADASSLLGRLLGPQCVAAEPEAVTELARLCGYLPLALRVAAAKVNRRSRTPVADCVAELGNLDILARLQIDGDELAAVGVAIGRSYAALSPEEQRLFRLLGVREDPVFTMHSAAELTSTPPHHVQRLAERLAEAQLIEPAGPGRFRFHHLVHVYAREIARSALDRLSARSL